MTSPPSITASPAKVVGRTKLVASIDRVESHEFILEGFSHLSTEVGVMIRSPNFTLFDHKFHISVSPFGSKQEVRGFLSVFVSNEGDEFKFDEKFELFAGIPTNSSVSLWSNPFKSISLCSKSNRSTTTTWNSGFVRTLRHEDLLRHASGNGNNDTITIRLTIRLPGESSTLDSALNKLNNNGSLAISPLETLSNDLGKLFESGIGFDAILKVQEKIIVEFKVHKLILSIRSIVFKVMFDGRFKEGNTIEPILIEDATAETLKELLRFIYSGVVDENTTKTFEQWSKLLEISERFDIKELFLLSQVKLESLLTPQNAIDGLSLAMKFENAWALKNSALDLLIKAGVPENIEPEVMLEIMKHLKIHVAPPSEPQP